MSENNTVIAVIVKNNKMTNLACFLFSMVTVAFAQPIEQGPTLKPTPSEILYRIGDRTKPLVLECATEKGESNVQFSWNKNGKPLQMNPNVIQQKNEGTLVFLQPTMDDSGDYKCFAKSEAGVASSRTLSVKPTYINAPEVKTVTHKPIEGRPFKLECTIPDSYPKPEIKWMYQFKTDPSISHSVLDKRITQSPDGTLWFSSVTKEDTHENFKYVCLAKTPASDGEIVLVERIIEDVVPDSGPRDVELEEQYVTRDMVAKKGDVTMIYCIYGGTPLSPPDWYKDGKNINGEPKDRVTRYNRSAGKRLLIRDTWLEDEGDYTCIVDNEIGQPKKHTMHLTVISAPEFVKKHEPIMVQKAGRDITIPCEVAGVPNAKVSWTFNAQTLQQNDRILFKQNENIGNITVADLIIKNVNVNDHGYYGCNAANDNGSVYAETLLNVS